MFCQLAIGLAVVALVSDHGARFDLAKFEQGFEQRRVISFASGEFEGDRLASMIRLQMDLGAEPATGTAERLAVLPPFAPAAET